MNCILYFLLFVLSLQLYADEKITVPVDKNGERHIVVVIASYNNKNYYQQNLGSVFDQIYKNYHVIYIDDCSTDGTYELVKAYIRRRNMQDKVLLIHNEERQGALHNQYYAIHRCKDTDIIINLDGDDWLFDKQVFEFINSTYVNPRIWLTYGQFKLHPSNEPGWCMAMPPEVIRKNQFREHGFIPGHLRTFYAGLFKRIKKEDLMYGGHFFHMTGDIAVMFPMIEMAREGHFQFIAKILMVYNDENPINNYKIEKSLERKCDLDIRGREKYSPIESPFLSQNGGVEEVLAANARKI